MHAYILSNSLYIIPVPCYRMGCPGFTSPEYEPHPETSVMKSLFYPDEVVVQPDEQQRFMYGILVIIRARD